MYGSIYENIFFLDILGVGFVGFFRDWGIKC